jgi:predicted Zn-dependent protease
MKTIASGKIGNAGDYSVTFEDGKLKVAVRSTAAQSTSNDILTRVTRIETDLELVKKATVAVDDRGPARQA